MLPHPLLGTWRLVSYALQAADGQVTYPYGPEPRGYLLYTGDGYMSVAFMRAGRQPYASGDRLRATPAELAGAAAGYVSYCGTYEITGDHVVHHIAVSLFPNWIGQDQVRYFTIAGRRLLLRTPPLQMDGAEQIGQVVWERP